MATPAEGLARLRAAADAGELDGLCRRHRIRVLTVFGSAAREDRLAAPPRPRPAGRPVTPRRLDVATLGRKLRAMRRLLDELHRLGAIDDAGRFAREFTTQLYVRQVARWVADRNG